MLWRMLVTLSWLLLAGEVAAQPRAFDHGRFDRVLAAHVRANGVDYAALSADRQELDAYLTELARVEAATFDAWPRAEQIAYLINAYNAIVLARVADRYPLRRSWRPAAWFRPANSVWQIPGFFSGIRRRVAGRDLTLDDIEHHWLRDVLGEPRIHFALVCAARSCPPLRREAFVADRLDAQLADQARRFFNDPAHNRFDIAAGEVRLSMILRWFGEDFDAHAPPRGFAGSRTERGVLAFAARFLPASTASALEAGAYRIDYLPYDWTLNDVPRR